MKKLLSKILCYIAEELIHYIAEDLIHLFIEYLISVLQSTDAYIMFVNCIVSVC